MIQDNLKQILEALESEALLAKRDPSEVKLIAVSKTKPVSAVKEAMAAGQKDFGENRVQELVEKHEQIPGANWHMIGSLQRNKVKYIAPFIHLIHSVSSDRLLAEIDKQAGKHDRVINCLLQINISDEDQKGGFTEAAAEAVLKNIHDYPNVRIQGLMGMAEFTSDEVAIDSQFHRLQLAAQQFSQLAGPQIQMRELSMGMSGDYPIAIRRGATMVRIGSAIFGYR